MTILNEAQMRSLWVQGYTVMIRYSMDGLTAFPVGTGIYRLINDYITITIRVPCGYRDIPRFFINNILTPKRSLWVQGYTNPAEKVVIYPLAFPVGTGIYRMWWAKYRPQKSVPCGYRDIPIFKIYLITYLMRSLWVQGYTGLWARRIGEIQAFPVGTGIYLMGL